MLVLIGSVTFAQTYWLQPPRGNNVTLQFYKPDFDRTGDELGSKTAVWFLSGKFRISGDFDLYVDLPVSRFDIKEGQQFYWIGDDQIATGNPYVGIRGRFSSVGVIRRIVGRIGLRPPLTSDDKQSATTVGRLTVYDRMEAFLPNRWSIDIGAGQMYDICRVCNLETDFGLITMIPTEDRADAEMWLTYGFAFWLRTSAVDLGAGLSGRWWATSEDTNFGRASVHLLGIAGVLKLGRVEPGIQFRLPADKDWRDEVASVVCLNLIVNLD